MSRGPESKCAHHVEEQGKPSGWRGGDGKGEAGGSASSSWVVAERSWQRSSLIGVGQTIGTCPPGLQSLWGAAQAASSCRKAD